MAEELKSIQASCSRPQSREVRSFLNTTFFSKIDPNYMSVICDLSPMNDLYLDQENHKQIVSRNEWKCLYCNKRFKNEHYIDKHMSIKHLDRLYSKSSTMACLADTCNIFGCRSHLPMPKSYSYEGSRGSRHNSAVRSAKNVFNICTQTDIHRARLQCEVLAERCFDQVQGQKFRSLACGNMISCENGVLTGAMHRRGPNMMFHGWIIQLGFMVLILLVVLIHGLSTSSLWAPLRDAWLKRPQRGIMPRLQPESRDSTLWTSIMKFAVIWARAISSKIVSYFRARKRRD